MQCPDVHANSILTFRFSALLYSSKFYLTARMDTLLTNTKYCRFRFNFLSVMLSGLRCTDL